jgi:predicted phosphodiesterase
MSPKKNKQSSWLDEEPYKSYIIGLVNLGEFTTTIVRSLHTVYGKDTTESSIKRFRKRHGLGIPTQEKGGLLIKGDEAEVIGHQTLTAYENPYPHLDDPEAMLRERGLDPEEWVLQGATLNEWDGPQSGGSIVTYHQAKLQLKRKQSELQILPARSDGWVAPPRATPTYGDQLIVVVGDQQAPYHDERLHDLFCSWLEENQPDRIICLGDLVDFPNISRHRLDPENTALVNECIQSGYDIIRDYRQAALNADIEFFDGNHDQRLRDILIDRSPQLYDIKRADTEEVQDEKVLTLPYLLRFDELGIKYIDPEGPYALGQINITPNLAVRHGWIARAGSGASALSTLNHLGYSCIIGHSHRQSIVYHTKHDINGDPSTLTGVEAGCMCRINQSTQKGRKWPNYTTAPDWQNGWATVSTHGKFFRIDLATYIDGALLWRDEIYQ